VKNVNFPIDIITLSGGNALSFVALAFYVFSAQCTFLTGCV